MPVPERLGRQVDRHLARQRVGHDERRRRQVVGAHRLLDATFEVAVAAQDRCHHQILRLDFRRDVVGQRPAVADAGGAAVADQVEAELIEIRSQTCLLADTR